MQWCVAVCYGASVLICMFCNGSIMPYAGQFSLLAAWLPSAIFYQNLLKYRYGVYEIERLFICERRFHHQSCSFSWSACDLHLVNSNLTWYVTIKWNAVWLTANLSSENPISRFLTFVLFKALARALMSYEAEPMEHCPWAGVLAES